MISSPAPTVTVDSTAIVRTNSPKWFGRASARVVDGIVILVYREGDSHALYDDSLHIKFSDDYGATWSDEDTTLAGAAVTNFPMYPPDRDQYENAMEPYLYVAPNGDLLIHMWRTEFGFTANGTYQARSTDGGATWTAPAAVDIVGQDAATDLLTFTTEDYFVLDSVIYAGGRVFADVTPSNTKRILIKSTDNGETWDYVSDVCGLADGGGEFGMEYLGSNRIIAVFRGKSMDKSYRSFSADLGLTWTALEDVTSVIPAIGRPRIYTRNHLKGAASWWQDFVLLMSGFVFGVGGRRNAVWISRDAGASWFGPFYVDDASEDGGYGDLFYNSLTGQYVFISYYGFLAEADVKQYSVTITGI